MKMVGGIVFLVRAATFRAGAIIAASAATASGFSGRQTLPRALSAATLKACLD
jgi:hypothetical protein